MNEMNITKYDMWRYRRCIETLERHYSYCENRRTCKGCTFDIPLNKVRYISS